MNLTCHKCGTLLVLRRYNTPNYLWACPNQCWGTIDTGAAANQPFDEFDGAEKGMVEFNATLFWPPMTPQRVTTAKVFMPHILYHFIECGRGACYNSLFTNVLVPHLDSVDVLDYVLKSAVVHRTSDSTVGNTEARIYPDLWHRLSQVRSSRIRQYLLENFPMIGGDC